MNQLQTSVAAGNLDEVFLNDLRGIARRQAGTRPSPSGAPRWSPEDIDDLIFDTISQVKPARVVLAANQAAGEAQFRKWLAIVIRTTLDQRARGTPGGRIIRAMDDALREAPG